MVTKDSPQAPGSCAKVARSNRHRSFAIIYFIQPIDRNLFHTRKNGFLITIPNRYRYILIAVICGSTMKNISRWILALELMLRILTGYLCIPINRKTKDIMRKYNSRKYRNRASCYKGHKLYN